MKRIIALGVLVVSLLIGYAVGRAVPPQSEQKPAAQAQKVAEGVTIFKLWEMTPLKKPKIALLVLSAEQQRKFEQDPIAFVNKEHKLFDPAAHTFQGRALFRLYPPNASGTKMVTLLVHDPDVTYIAGGSFEVSKVLLEKK